MAEEFERAGVGFVDATVQGPAARLAERGTLFLSGEGAGEVARAFGNRMRVVVLEGPAGSASRLKMLLGGLAKGVAALYLEVAVSAAAFGLLDEVNEAARTQWPGVLELAERMLPTFPRHSGRRVDELRAVERTIEGHGLCPEVIPGARRLLARVDAQALDPEPSWTSRDVVEALRGMLDGEAQASRVDETQNDGEHS